MDRAAAERRVRTLTTTRPKWTEGEAREVMAAWAASGESATAFGRRNGIVPQRLYWWRSRLACDPPSFVELEVHPPAASPVVVIEGTTRIEIGSIDSASAAWVATLVCALRERGS